MTPSTRTAQPNQFLKNNRLGPIPGPALNRESLIVVLVGGLIIYLMAAKAFPAYFFGENFIYLQQYQNHGNHFWSAFFSPIGGIFFRPVVLACDLPWHFLLPTTPLAFHLRNFGLIVVELFLLHRILCRVVAAPSARILGCAFFAVSKIPLSLIGYINTIDSLVLSTLLLLSVLFFLRFTQSRNPSDYTLGLTCCLLSHFSKDYGLVINAVVVTIVLIYGIDWQNRSRELRWWAWRALPLALITVGYFGVRISVLGSVMQRAAESGTGYAPKLLSGEFIGKMLRFSTTLCNTAWVDDGSNGTRGLVAWIAASFHSSAISAITLSYCLLCGSALGGLFWLGRKAGVTLILPLVWAAAYLGPTLLVQGVTIYYHWESMIGIAVLLALLADAAGKKYTWAIGLPLISVIGLSGFLSNQTPNYPWTTVANQTKGIEKMVVEKYRHTALASITFLSKAPQIQGWKFALADPMLQQLMRQPALEIKYVAYADIAHYRVFTDKTHLVLDTERDFAPVQPDAVASQNPTEKLGPPVLVAVAPKTTLAGRAFNEQPNGLSAISIECTNASPRSILLWNGTPLPTFYGNSLWLTALVPKELYAAPGTYEISIATDGVASNKVPFQVRPPP